MLADVEAVEGVGNGPVKSWQPAAHPVAAGPTKVGECVPRLDVVAALTSVVAALVLTDLELLVADPLPGKASSSDTPASNPRRSPLVHGERNHRDRRISTSRIGL